MTIESQLEQARHDVLIENTGQDVLKLLKRLENQRSLLLSRWVWELLQNARDAAGDQQITVTLGIEDARVSFAHNGRPFESHEIAHLIYHGSTKQQDPDSVGQFGTGFISTHVISPTVRVSGVLKDELKRFDFTLSRQGESARDLSAAMDRSWQEFEGSLKASHPIGKSITTTFAYPVRDGSTLEALNSGIESLRQCAAFVLAFNRNFAAIVVDRKGSRRDFSIETNADYDSRTGMVVIDKTVAITSRLIVETVTGSLATVAAALRITDGKLTVQPAGTMPRLFLAFPLSGTSDFPFPVVINSDRFTPTDERDGVHLGTSDSRANVDNLAAIKDAGEALLLLIRRGIERNWDSLSALARFSPIEEKAWLRPERLIEWHRSLVKRVIDEPMIDTIAHTRVSAAKSWIPIDPAIWALTAQIEGAAERLPAEGSYQAWGRCVEGWAAVLGVPVDEVPGSWTTRRLVAWAAEFKTCEALQRALAARVDVISWLNGLLRLVQETNATRVFDTLALLPNQDGTFVLRSKLKIDPGLDQELKEICALLGDPITSRLLHLGIDKKTVNQLIDEESEDNVVGHALVRLKERSDDPSESHFVSANIAFFSWLVKERRFDILQGFVALTLDESRTITLTEDDDDDRPLVPVERWPSNLRAFGMLFPKRLVLSSRYLEQCADEGTWSILCTELGLLPSPVYTTEAVVERFVHDELWSGTDAAQTHASVEPQAVTRIAYLNKEDIGIIDLARKSAAKAASLFEMILVIVSDDLSRQLEPVKTDCSCERSHNYLKGDWISPLQERKWIPLGPNRADRPTAASLAHLVRGFSDSNKILRSDAFSAIVRAFGIGLADVSLLAVADSEEARVTLVQAFTGIVDAAHGNAATVEALANEVQQNPKFVDELRERREVRETVGANKALGAAVEMALKAALEGRGLTVTRTGVGSDFEVESDILENEEEVWFRISSNSRSILLEIKATKTSSIRMTRRQAQTAVSDHERFVLCVVEVSSASTDSIVVDGARFVIGIGTRLEPLWKKVTELESMKDAAQLSDGNVEVVIADSQIKFQVFRDVWRQALTLAQFIEHAAPLALNS